MLGDIIDNIKYIILSELVWRETRMHIRYIKKTNNSKYYGGLFSKFIDKGILQLYTKGRKWMIYKDDSCMWFPLIFGLGVA